MDMLASVLGILSTGVIGAGTLIIIWNGISAGSAIKDHNGPQIQNSLWGVAGGAIIVAMGVFLTQVKF